MHINRSLEHHRITGTKSRIIAEVHNLLGQPSYESMTKMFEQFNKLHIFAYWNIKHNLLLLADFFFKINFYLQKIISGIPPECQTVWILIRCNVLSGLNCIQTVCKVYQYTTLACKELKG